MKNKKPFIVDRRTDWTIIDKSSIITMPKKEIHIAYMLTTKVGYYDWMKNRDDWCNEVPADHPRAKSYGFPYWYIMEVVNERFEPDKSGRICTPHSIKTIKCDIFRGKCNLDMKYVDLPDFPFYRPRGLKNMAGYNIIQKRGKSKKNKSQKT